MKTTSPQSLAQKFTSSTAAVLTALTLGAVLASGPAHAAKSEKPVQIDDVAIENPDFAKLFNVTPKQFKGMKKIAIPIFTVESAIKTGAGIRADYGDGVNALTVTYLLAGVPEKEMQAAVNGAYDELVADLKAIGVEVVPADAVKATAAYKKAARTLTSPTTQSGGSAEALVFSAHDMALGLSNSRFIFTRTMQSTGSGAGGQIMGLVQMANMVGQMASQVSDASVANEIGAELGVPTLTVQIPLEFITTKVKSQGFFSGGSSVEVGAALRLSISPQAIIAFNSLNSSASEFQYMMTTAPMTVAGTPVKEVRDTSSIALNLGLMALSSLAGSKSSSSIKEKTAEADPVKYVESAAYAARKFSKLVVETVKAMQ